MSTLKRLPMNKHLKCHLQMAVISAERSNCPRAKHGAVIFDPATHAVVSTGYNGAARGGGRLCGGEVCARDELQIPSGTSIEIGCCHAESNAIDNAARLGHRTDQMHIAVTAEPCMSCAKRIVQSGIKTVHCLGGRYTRNGLDFLRQHGVTVDEVSEDQWAE